MKIKIPEITNRQERMLKKGKAVQLIKVPKGKRIFWYKDGKHYKLVLAEPLQRSPKIRTRSQKCQLK